jgi:drug/metabolite transporter (DMT)-like permease
MTIIASIASLFLKKASECDNILLSMKNVNLYIGGGLYVIAALLNVYILRYLEYSVVMPMGSLTYIWTMILSYRFLKEDISRKEIIGVLLIIIGAISISYR